MVFEKPFVRILTVSTKKKANWVEKSWKDCEISRYRYPDGLHFYCLILSERDFGGDRNVLMYASMICWTTQLDYHPQIRISDDEEEYFCFSSCKKLSTEVANIVQDGFYFCPLTAWPEFFTITFVVVTSLI